MTSGTLLALGIMVVKFYNTPPYMTMDLLKFFSVYEMFNY